MAVVRARLETVTAIAHHHRATVNDMLLTAAAGGLRELLLRRDESVDDLTLRAVVPVSLHDKIESQPAGNRLGQLIAPLPLGRGGPIERLQVITAATAQRKRAVQPRLVPPTSCALMRTAALWIMARQQMIGTSVTDITGPREPVFFAGAPVHEIVPMIALMGNVAVGVAGFFYAGRFTITIVGDSIICPDVDIIATGIENTLASLQSARPVA